MSAPTYRYTARGDGSSVTGDLAADDITAAKRDAIARFVEVYGRPPVLLEVEEEYGPGSIIVHYSNRYAIADLLAEVDR